MLIRRDLSVVERAQVNSGREYVVPANIAINDATTEQPIIYLPNDADFVGALVKLKDYDDLYLYVARPIDPRVIGYLKTTRETLSDYESLEQRRFGVQVAFALMYAVITLIVLLSAVWLGINFSKWLVAPIRRLISAANHVAEGNLDVQVPIYRSEGDLAALGETFNKMTSELRAQRAGLLQASAQIDSRRRFTEAVLSGVGAGVIGLDSDERVTILNRSAEIAARRARGGCARASVGGGGARDRRSFERSGRFAPARHPGQHHGAPRGPRPHFRRARHHGAIQRGGAWLGGDAGRHHRSDPGAAHLRLGGRGPAHRP